MKYVHTKELQDGVTNLKRRGNKYARAARSVVEILGYISSGADNPFENFSVTNHGEKRLKHCIKYDLTGFCRLVTVVDAGYTLLLYVGDHDDVNDWLDKNRGKSFGVDGVGQLVETLRVAELGGEGAEEVRLNRGYVGESVLLRRLDHELVDVLLEPLSYKVGLALSELTTFSSADAINEACSGIKDESLADTMLDVLIALGEGNITQAEARIHLYQGTYLDLENAPGVVGGPDLQFVPTDSPEWVQLYEHFASTAGYKDWMLFLHPDQAHVVEEDFNGPAKLAGVSGSGKTCIVVKRALRLAQKYPSERILILTLNRPLAKLIGDLVDEATPSNLRMQIEVKPFFEICQQLIYRFEPGSERYYSDVTWLNKGYVDEHIDAVWREFYRCDLNNLDAAVMHPVHDSLITQGVNAEEYIREEFDWIRSAIAHTDRNLYLDIERRGRSFPLAKHFRKMLLDGLSAWECKMQSVGVIDRLGLVVALQPWLNQIKNEYRAVLVDESQDFGTSEMKIIRKLVESAENDLFICGDAAQKVSSCYQKLSTANIIIPGARSRKILKNYRNSFEILTASHQMLMKSAKESDDSVDDFDVLNPIFADFHGPAPLLLEADNLEQEIGNALAFVEEETSHNRNWKACIALAGFSLYQVQTFAKELKMPVLDGTRSIDEHSIYFSDLPQTKGFEFDVMVVVNISEGVMPNPNVPAMEQGKDLAQLYVAMTRAKTQLVVSYNGKPSNLIAGLDDAFLVDRWASYNSQKVNLYGIPPTLADLNEDTRIPENIALMDGHQFLYTEHAIGLNSALIEAIREKIGRSDTHQGRLTVAVDLGFVYQGLIEDARKRIKFGREVSKDFRELGSRIGLEDLHRLRHS